MSAYVNRPSTDSARRFSVELETATCEGYSDCAAETGFTAHYDGSISGREFHGSKLSGNEGLSACVAFCHYANRKGWQVDSRCGFHAHFDMSNETADTMCRIGKAYKALESLFLGMVRSKRVKGIYTCPISWNVSELERIDDTREFYQWASGLERYMWANFAAYAKHTTLEIRLHPGTLDANKVCYWVCAHLAIIEWARTATDSELDRLANATDNQKLVAVCRIVGEGSATAAYLVKRAKRVSAAAW